jgi:spore coat polysaccharide biosynthesis protein SpsF
VNRRVVTVIQARMGSTRLPGKVMRPVLGRPILELQLERMSRAVLVGEIVVATTEDPADDAIADLADSLGYFVYRGHATNLLHRHYHAALPFAPETVVKIPSDCPLIDPSVIDRVIAAYYAEDCDYCSNLHPASYPDGNDVEVMSFGALRTALEEATKSYELEHTTPFFWEQPERFRVRNVLWEDGRDFSLSHRFTLDYPEDFDFIRAVYSGLYSRKAAFTLGDILVYLEENPVISGINHRFAGVNWYRHHLSELRTITAAETRMPNLGQEEFA